MVQRSGLSPPAHEPFETSTPRGAPMLAPRPHPAVTSETWNGHWGADARYYARRSDGACFAIDGAVNVFDLAGTTPPSPHARPVDSLPVDGEYTLSVFAQRPEP